MSRILYVEDDETLGALTTDSLQMNAHEVVHLRNGFAALEVFMQQHFDICILDILIPGISGFVLAEEIRKCDTQIPILFLSAKSLREDRLKGLRLGADDYMIKPFSIEELLLKIDVFLNRPKKMQGPQSGYPLGNSVFESENFCIVQADGSEIRLTEKEAQLLKMFLAHRNQVLKRAHILKALWGEDDYFKGRSLDVFVSRLRKLLAGEAAVKIENIHSIGFRMMVRED